MNAMVYADHFVNEIFTGGDTRIRDSYTINKIECKHCHLLTWNQRRQRLQFRIFTVFFWSLKNTKLICHINMYNIHNAYRLPMIFIICFQLFFFGKASASELFQSIFRLRWFNLNGRYSSSNGKHNFTSIRIKRNGFTSWTWLSSRTSCRYPNDIRSRTTKVH